MRISDWSSDVCSSDLKPRYGNPAMSGPCLDALTIGSDPMSDSTVALAADHAGFALKEALKGELEALGYACLDLGTADATSVDRKRAVLGKSGSVRVYLGGRRIIKKTNNTNNSI